MPFCKILTPVYNGGMKKFIPPLALLILSCSSLAQTSYVAPTKTLAKGGSEINLSADYFKSSTRIGKDGEELDFLDGEGFQRMQGTFAGSYGLTDELQISVGALLRSQVATFAETTGEEDATAQGIESTWLKLMYAFKPVNRLYYALEGEYRYRPYTNKEFNTGDDKTELILGDDGDSYSFGLGVTYHSPKNNFFTVRGGYRRPGQELSDEIYYQAEAALAWPRFALVAGVNGVYSLGRDPNEGETRISLNTATTLMYHQENREWIAPYAGVNFSITPSWRVELTGSQVVSGKSTDLGTSFGISLVRRSEKVNPTQKLDRSFKSYDIEASISKVSPKANYVVIDKGVADDIAKGMVFDFYEFDYVGGNELLARGTVIRVQSESSIIKITSRFKANKPLKEGTLARASHR